MKMKLSILVLCLSAMAMLASANPIPDESNPISSSSPDEFDPDHYEPAFVTSTDQPPVEDDQAHREHHDHHQPGIPFWVWILLAVLVVIGLVVGCLLCPRECLACLAITTICSAVASSDGCCWAMSRMSEHSVPFMRIRINKRDWKIPKFSI